eukprot:scaffold3026_cov221-Pinguiococcus_pyrenoidosus.AAC.4
MADRSAARSFRLSREERAASSEQRAAAHLRSFAGASWAFSLAGEVHNLACVMRGRGHGRLKVLVCSSALFESLAKLLGKCRREAGEEVGVPGHELVEVVYEALHADAPEAERLDGHGKHVQVEGALLVRTHSILRRIRRGRVEAEKPPKPLNVIPSHDPTPLVDIGSQNRAQRGRLGLDALTAKLHKDRKRIVRFSARGVEHHEVVQVPGVELVAAAVHHLHDFRHRRGSCRWDVAERVEKQAQQVKVRLLASRRARALLDPRPDVVPQALQTS